MIGLFFASVLAGFVLCAPFGPVGALVADAALAHDRKRLDMTVASAVMGNGILAFLVSLGADHIKQLLERYDGVFFLATGAIIIILGVALGAGTVRQRGITVADTGLKGSIPVLSIFLVTLFHPGSISAFLFLTAFFVLKLPSFPDHRGVFAAGVTIGSLFAFGPVGLFFWKMRRRAEGVFSLVRYGLASIIVIAGLYMVVRGSTSILF